MNNSPEEIEALKIRAFRPPEVKARDDLKVLVQFTLISGIISFGLYILIGYGYILIQNEGWEEMKLFILRISFAGSIIFGIFRTLRFTMAQTASDAYMIFPMKTENVRGHLRDLISLATSLEWDLTGLIGSVAVLLTFFFIIP